MNLSFFKNMLMISAASFVISCSSSSIKEKINQAGNIAGQAAGEFTEGAGKGLVKAFDIKVTISGNLTAQGITLGKTAINSDSSGTDDVLAAYVIFNKAFRGTLTAKVFDDQSLEMGRASVTVDHKAGEAMYVDFHFDPRTNVDSKNLVTIE
jgi:hypothetical protein